MLDTTTKPTIWTEERVTFLKSQWMVGYSASQIAADLGCGISRNAVIGKANRLGLTHENRPRRRARSYLLLSSAERELRRTQAKARAVKVMVVQKVHENGKSVAKLVDAVVREPDADLEEFNAAIPHHQRCTLLELTDDTCRWPIGDPGTPDFHFCGGKPEAGIPYCGYHARVAYQTPEVRRDRRPAPARFGFDHPITTLKAFGA